MGDLSDELRAGAFRRSGGHCECTRPDHAHRGLDGRCTKSLTAISGEYHYLTAVGPGADDGSSIYEYLCEPCHKAITSHSRR